MVLGLLLHTQPSFSDSGPAGDEFWIRAVSPLLAAGKEKVESSVGTYVLCTAWHSQLCFQGTPDGHWTDPAQTFLLRLPSRLCERKEQWGLSHQPRGSVL